MDAAGGVSVFGILGSRRSSPFKCINVGQAVRHQEPPRVTRLEERKETLAPSVKDFAKSKSADEFRDSVSEPGEGGCSNEALGRFPSSCFVHQEVDVVSAVAGRRKPFQTSLGKELERREPKTPSIHQENASGPRLPESTRRDEVDLQRLDREDQ
jgi:hypothetical protein